MKIITDNKKARFNYHIEERFEAGIVLTGAEIKSIRAGQMSLAESYIVPEKDELYLLHAHIKPYTFDSSKTFDPVRKRKLLMHRHEINKLRGRVEAKGYTLVPTKVYLKGGLAKVEVALAKGKAAPDKRQTIKERDAKREAQRALKAAKR